MPAVRCAHYACRCAGYHEDVTAQGNPRINRRAVQSVEPGRPEQGPAAEAELRPMASFVAGLDLYPLSRGPQRRDLSDVGSIRSGVSPDRFYVQVASSLRFSSSLFCASPFARTDARQRPSGEALPIMWSDKCPLKNPGVSLALSGACCGQLSAAKTSSDVHASPPVTPWDVFFSLFSVPGQYRSYRRRTTQTPCIQSTAIRRVGRVTFHGIPWRLPPSREMCRLTPGMTCRVSWISCGKSQTGTSKICR